MKVLVAPLLLLLAAPLASAQTPCTAPEASTLDFWVGQWELSWPAPGDTTGALLHGTNTITRTLGGCVVEERFKADTGFEGMSVSVFQPATGQWHQTWVDNGGGYLTFTGTPALDGAMELRTSPFTNAQGQQQTNRMTWREVTADALTWHWQASTDGGQTWRDLWVIRYQRAAPDG